MPSLRFHSTRSTPVVQRLIDAGAIPIGKTNMDQFATGLVGTRSPYGACSSVFDERYISGGSSSGSAVAVASGQVHFALGTDTAGSGRVPAAFNNLVGLKPTRGLLSTSGVVPACRSIDCVTILTRTVADGGKGLRRRPRIRSRRPLLARSLPPDRAPLHGLPVPSASASRPQPNWSSSATRMPPRFTEKPLPISNRSAA